ncbi:type I restriction endonuclease subunit R [Neomoorella thermoacetica]|uniref:type I restriction endonuclease subunit R n=1 Tax=Neomoorella thermoacetica TaxID=1525 RepID=UPI0030D2C765
MPLGSERAAVQNPFIRYATEAGWQYIIPQDLELRRGGVGGLIDRQVFISQLQKLNPGVVDHLRAEEVLKRLERLPPTIEGNLQAWEYLKGLRTVYVETEKRERNIRLLDLDNWRANIFQVTDEFTYTNGTYTIRADIVFLINGIPVLVVETKSTSEIEGIAKALDQMRRYHREAPELMALEQVYALTHLVHFYYGTTWSLSRKNLFNWRDESIGQDYETLVKSFIHPQRVLRVLTDFIMFTRRDDELSKVILRPHQMRAIGRVLNRALDPTKKRGLVWHTQGSGKTYTMITIAKKLIEDPRFDNPTVLMLVDRNELEQQLFNNLAACGLGMVEVARSKRHLQELLASDRRGLIVSMIHKFDDIPAKLNCRDNIFVLVDEAHRTTGGNLGNYLMGALPNATYIGFTGTPIDRTAHGKGTFKVFGCDDQPQGYLDKYSIAESIADGTTVPLHYSLAPNDLRVDRETLEEEFLNLAAAEGVSDIEELNKVLEKAVTLRNMLKNRERVDRIAAYVARHYREYIEPMGYKAFLVAVDREACTLYKEALDKYLPPEYSQVVISRAHNDQPYLARYYLSEEEEKRVRRAFRQPGELPKILIVTEKLLTGYDAPVLYCMYLDKPMRDHVLLQAIARVNRPYEDENGHQKPAGFVLDFVGIFENLEKALAFDSKDIEGTIQDLDILKNRFQEMIAEGRRKYLAIIENYKQDKAAEKALEHFREPQARQEYYAFFKELANLFEIISPDPFLREYLDDYDQLARLYRLLRSVEPGVNLDHELKRKTARLVQEHTLPGAIQDAVTVYQINEEALERIAETRASYTVEVFNLLKSLENTVAAKRQEAPYLLSIGEMAERIAQAYQERQLSTQEALQRLQSLIQEYLVSERERAEKDMAPETYAVYWYLKRQGIKGAEEVALNMARAFINYPYWKSSESQERQIVWEFYKNLKRAGLKAGNKLGDIVDQIMKLIKGARR